MTTLHSNYAKVMRKNTFLHVPSCMIVEMLMKLYSQISYIKTTADIKNTAEELQLLLNRLSGNIKCTVDAFREGRIKAFIGNWESDKLRARRSAFNILSRLGHITERLTEEDRRKIHEAITKLTGQWLELDSIMRANSQKLPDEVCMGGSCQSQECDSQACRHKALAKKIIALNDSANYENDDAYLLLLCYKGIKESLFKAIREVREEEKMTGDFPYDRILCTSEEDVLIDCQKCMQMSDSFRRGVTVIIHDSYSNVRRTRFKNMTTSIIQDAQGQ